MTISSIRRVSTRPAVGLAVAALAIPALAACTGEVIQTGGNGTAYIEENVRVENATIVAGEQDSGKAAFLGTVYNTGQTDDEILSITAGGIESSLQPSPVVILPEQNAAIQTGKEVTADFTGWTANTGTYVPVSIRFKNAGEASFKALVVPPVGYYASAAPEGTQPRPESPREPIISDNIDSAGDEGNTDLQGSDGAAPAETESDAGALESHNAGQ